MEFRWLRRLLDRVAPDTLEATRERAQRGDADAQFALGVICENHAEPDCDLEAAAAWFRNAAVQNHARAQFRLGLLYAEGRGVPRDDREALGWIEKAAAQGDAEAQFELGSRRQRASFGRPKGETTELRIEAYKWFRLAAGQGSQPSAAAWEQMALAMSADEVAEANRRTLAFTATRPATGC